jgi:hypothetical protein
MVTPQLMGYDAGIGYLSWQAHLPRQFSALVAFLRSPKSKVIQTSPKLVIEAHIISYNQSIG